MASKTDKRIKHLEDKLERTREEFGYIINNHQETITELVRIIKGSETGKLFDMHGRVI